MSGLRVKEVNEVRDRVHLRTFYMIAYSPSTSLVQCKTGVSEDGA